MINVPRRYTTLRQVDKLCRIKGTQSQNNTEFYLNCFALTLYISFFQIYNIFVKKLWLYFDYHLSKYFSRKVVKLKIIVKYVE